MGLIATIAALVSGLLIASAHSAYDTQESEVRQLAVHLALLDRILAHYGPEAAACTDRLREVVVGRCEAHLARPGCRVGYRCMAGQAGSWRGRVRHDRLVGAAPDEQRFGQARALQLLTDMATTRRLMSEQAGGSLSWPFFVVLVFWLVVLFLGFGLFARLNATVLAASPDRRGLRRRRDLPDPGDEPALQRIDAHLQRADAQRAGAVWANSAGAQPSRGCPGSPPCRFRRRCGAGSRRRSPSGNRNWAARTAAGS